MLQSKLAGAAALPAGVEEETTGDEGARGRGETEADLVFLSPPWFIQQDSNLHPRYAEAERWACYSLNSLLSLPQYDEEESTIYAYMLYTLFQAAQRIAPNIIMFLPRNVDIRQVKDLSWLCSPPLHFKSEENYVQGRSKGITAYFGDVARS